MSATWTAFNRLVQGSASVRAALFAHNNVLVRGLASAVNITQGELVLEVPPELVLSAAHPAVERFFKGSTVEEPDSTWRLICFLAAERRLGAASPWSHYLQHLPGLTELKRTHPLWARQQLLVMFAPLPITRVVANYQKMLKSDWHAWVHFRKWGARDIWPGDPEAPAHIMALRGAAANVTLEDMEWAFTNVLTRGMGSTRGTALVPVADDLNTEVPARQNARWHFSPEGSLKVFATKPVYRGEELLTGYAERTGRDNEFFVSTWGFALSGNEERTQSLSFKDCARLTAAVTRRPLQKTGEAGTCGAPKREKQPQIFCALLALAREHCPYVEELRG